MAKQNLLLVDADVRSLRVLEVSLRKAGYSVATSSDARGALEMMELSKPDLILSDTRLPQIDGFAFIEEIRKNAELSDVPLIFLSSDTSVESKVKGLELGVEDYLTKPIYMKEIVARVNVVLQRKRREGIELRQTSKQKFTGALSDIGVVDLLQTIDNSKKSGVLHLTSTSARGAIYFRNGNPVDAELGKFHGARAIYRALVWTEGSFEIDFREVRREDVIQTSTQGVLMEGMRRLDEWGRLLEQLPDLESVFEVNDQQLLERLAEIPDEINRILRHFDGAHSLMQVVDSCGQDDLETLTAISKLYFEGLIFNTGRKLEQSPEPELPSDLDVDAELSDNAPESSASRPDLDELVPGHALSALPPAAGGDSDLDPTSTMDYARAPDGSGGAARPRKGKKRRRGDSALISTTLTGMQTNGAARHDTEDEMVAPFTQRPASDRPGDRRMSVTNMRAAEDSRRSTATMRAADVSATRALPEDPRKSTATMRAVDVPAARALADDPRKSTAAMRAVDPAAASSYPRGLDDELDEKGEPRMVRVRRQRKRKKRLSLTTSPGMLSAHDPASLADLDDGDDETLPDTVEMDLPEQLKALQRAAPNLAPRPAAPPALKPAAEPAATEKKSITAAVPASSARAILPNNGSTARPVHASPSLLSAVDAPFKPSLPAAARNGSPSRAPFPREEPRVRAPDPPKPAPPRPKNPEQARAQSPVQPPPARQTAPQPALPSAVEDWSHTSTLPPAPRKRAWLYGALLLGAAVVVSLLVQESSRAPAEVPAPAQLNQLRPAEQPEQEPAQPQAAEPEAPAAVAPEPAHAEPSPSAAAEPAQKPEAPAEPQPAAVSGEPAAEGGGDALDAAAVLEDARKLDEQGKAKQALALYESAAKRLPRNSLVLSRLAFGYLNRGRNNDASTYAARAVEIDPTNSEGWIVLGAGKSELGDRKAAKEAYRKCVELGRGPYVAECKRMVR